MKTKVRIVRSRWWAVVLRLLLGVLGPLFVTGAAWNGISDIDDPFSLTAFLAIGFLLIIFSFVIILSLNGLRYRLEVDANGFGVRGLLFSRRFDWREVTEIGAFSNYKAPGFHVGFRVDGSNNPRREILQVWNSTHRILPGMELGGEALAKYLRDRWRTWQRANRLPD